MKKQILKYIITFFIMVIMFIITLTATSLIPRKCLEENVSKSADILIAQSNMYLVKVPIKNDEIFIDNYIDALMINTAYSIDTKTPLYSALTARKNYLPNKTEEVFPDTNGELRSSKKYERFSAVEELKDTVNEEETESFEYARYWHGYLIALRPLLMFFDITQMRYVFLRYDLDFRNSFSI